MHQLSNYDMPGTVYPQVKSPDESTQSFKQTLMEKKQEICANVHKMRESL